MPWKEDKRLLCSAVYSNLLIFYLRYLYLFICLFCCCFRAQLVNKILIGLNARRKNCEPARHCMLRGAVEACVGTRRNFASYMVIWLFEFYFYVPGLLNLSQE